MDSSRNLFIWLLLLLLLAPSALLAQQDSVETGLTGQIEQPFCSGFNPETKSWGLLVLQIEPEGIHCPKDAAFMATQTVFGVPNKTDRQRAILGGNCCPLPPGSLTEEHVFASIACPEDHVVTGARVAPDSIPADWNNLGKLSYQLRCTRIDTNRFILGPPAQTLRVDPVEYSEETRSRVLFAEPAANTARALIPAHLRYGLGRDSRTTWMGTFCVGYPWGAVLTEMGHRTCQGFGFRPLLLKSGAPLTEPKCRAVHSIYSEQATCIP